MLLITGSAQAKDIIYYGGDRNSYNLEMLGHVLSYQVDKNYNFSSFFSDIPKQQA